MIDKQNTPALDATESLAREEATGGGPAMAKPKPLAEEELSEVAGGGPGEGIEGVNVGIRKSGGPEPAPPPKKHSL